MRRCAVWVGGLCLGAVLLSTACHQGTLTARPAPAPAALAAHPAFLDTLEERTFRYFWDLADPHTGLAPDRAPTRSFASIAATGFALTAYPIGIERGYITREEGRARVLATLRFLKTARQDTTIGGVIGYRGFFYHFLVPETGARFEQVELSTMDTALLLGGVLFCQSYFQQATGDEVEIHAVAESLYARVDWQWASVRPPTIGHGWAPEEGFLAYDWRGYNEAMILYILALGSPTYPVSPAAWSAWTSGYRWGSFEGQEHLGFAPLFGHQYTHVWIDLRGIQGTGPGGRIVERDVKAAQQGTSTDWHAAEEAPQTSAPRVSAAAPLPAQIVPDRRQEARPARSEERRVGKECRSRWSPYH